VQSVSTAELINEVFVCATPVLVCSIMVYPMGLVPTGEQIDIWGHLQKRLA
jgi:hypothetical protein